MWLCSLHQKLTILHHHRHSCLVELLSKEAKIAEFTTSIQFDAVKPKVDSCLNIADIVVDSVESFRAHRRTPRWHILMLITAAVVAVPETKTITLKKGIMQSSVHRTTLDAGRDSWLYRSFLQHVSKRMFGVCGAWWWRPLSCSGHISSLFMSGNRLLSMMGYPLAL
jgi:hypothetical protein